MEKRLLKTIINVNDGRKWEIYEDDGEYGYMYYEFFSDGGWKFVGEDWNYKKDCLEIVLGVEIGR